MPQTLAEEEGGGGGLKGGEAPNMVVGQSNTALVQPMYPAPPPHGANMAALPKNQAKQRCNAHPMLRQDRPCA